MSCDVVWSTSMHKTRDPRVAMGVAKHGHDGSRVWVLGSWWVCATRRFQKKKNRDIRHFPNHCRLDCTPHRIASVWITSWHVHCRGRRFAHHRSTPTIMSRMNLARMWTKQLTWIPTHHATPSRKFNSHPVPTWWIRIRNKRPRIWTMSIMSQRRV